MQHVLACTSWKSLSNYLHFAETSSGVGGWCSVSPPAHMHHCFAARTILTVLYLVCRFCHCEHIHVRPRAVSGGILSWDGFQDVLCIQGVQGAACVASAASAANHLFSAQSADHRHNSAAVHSCAWFHCVPAVARNVYALPPQNSNRSHSVV